jgi:hypothetical protein
MATFYLGTHLPGWLGQTDVPLCVSLPRLAGRKQLPRALGPVFLDGGGFTELSQHGGWRLSGPAYAAAMGRVCAEVGGIRHAAIQDWMCEPFVLAKTGRTLREHQQRTVESYGELRVLAPDVPWLPVLQGWAPDDYLDHLEQYQRAGFDLRRAPLVGVGSVCRRQQTDGTAALLSRLHGQRLRLHGFGLKVQGLTKAAGSLASADSMAWSFDARRRPTWCGSTTHKNCANCLPFALDWRARVVSLLSRRGGWRQLALAV